MRFFAVTPVGIESVTKIELERLSASHNIKNIEPAYGGIYFEGDLKALYAANLWLRTASRILRPIREFTAITQVMLYDQVRRVHWEEYLDPEKTFMINCTITGADDTFGKQKLSHSHFVSLKIKDSIVDRLRTKYGSRPNVSKENPDITIHAYINKTRCTLSLDSSGSSLHERGYKEQNTRAPLKETLAAAIIELTEWNGETPFIDPMCGSGTLVIEAALKALKIPPGLFREKFGFMGWPDFNSTMWNELLQNARENVQTRSDKIIGYDHDRKTIATAIENVKNIQLEKNIHIEKRNVSELEPVGKVPGVVVINPPYGERLGEVEELKGLYKQIGDLFKQKMKGWTGYIFTGNPTLVKSVGLRTSRRFELYNGPIECRLLKYDLY